MAFFSPSFLVAAFHGFKPLSDNITNTALGLTTFGYYVKSFANFESLKTLPPTHQLATLACVAPAITAFVWFSGKNVGKAFKEVNEHRRLSELEHPSEPQAQA